MIDIKVSQTSIDYLCKQLNEKVNAMSAINMPQAKQDIANVIFTLAGKDFLRQTNAIAMSDKKRFHHIYEWNKVGVNDSRLFKLIKTSNTNGILKISTNFLESKTVVPINPALKGRNKKGQFTGKNPKAKYIFKNKADIMESGRSVFIRAKTAKALVFMGREGKPVFIRKPKGVLVMNPGGSIVKGAYSSHFQKWFSNKNNISAAVAKTSFVTNLESQLAKYIEQANANKAVGLKVISTVSNAYAKGVQEL